MLGSEAKAASPQILLNPVSAANTAAATSAWVDVRRFEGDVEVLLQAGAITGSLTYTLEQASDAGGTGATALVPDEGAIAASANNTVRKATFRASSTLGFVRCVGTIVTGPSLVSALLQGRPKNF